MDQFCTLTVLADMYLSTRMIRLFSTKYTRKYADKAEEIEDPC